MLSRFIYRWLGIFLKRFDRRKLASKVLLRDAFDYGIRNAQIVNSWSIVFACDIHPDDPITAQIDTTYVDGILNRLNFINKRSGLPPSIYIQSKWLIHFSQTILPQIHQPFILVSGDNDTAINRATLGNNLDLILDHPYLVRWYAQNKDYDSPKLRAIPIGINLYNLWLDPLQWGADLFCPPSRSYKFRRLLSKHKGSKIDYLSSFVTGIFRWTGRIDKYAMTLSIDRFAIFNPPPYLQQKPGGNNRVINLY